MDSQNEDIDETDTNNHDESSEYCDTFLENSMEGQETPSLVEESTEVSLKSTFKSSLQAKKRLQAFSSQKIASVSPSTSKSRMKPILVSEKTYNEQGELQEILVPLKKPPKKGDNPVEKARAVIEEIELLKKHELSKYLPFNDETKCGSQRSRTKSKSSEREFIFRKREKKVRNYRRNAMNRRSPSPTITTAKEKTSKCSYPRNWKDFKKDSWTFEKLCSKSSSSSSRNNNFTNDITRQLLFVSPAESIRPYYYKNEKGEETQVPYHFLRFTSTKPKISFSINAEKNKECHLKRDQVLEKTHRRYRNLLEKFLNRSTKPKFKTTEPIGQRNWYQKVWKDNESKVLETSIGLSFLQTYSDDDEEDEEIPFAIGESLKNDMFAKKEKDMTELQLDHTITKEESMNEWKKALDDRKGETLPLQLHRAVDEQNLKRNEKSTINVSIHSSENESRYPTMKSDLLNQENLSKGDAEGSWTPDRISTPPDKIQTITEQSNRDYKDRKKNDSNREALEEKQKAREIFSEDEWDETPRRKNEKENSDECEVKKNKKTRKKLDSESSSSPGKKKDKKKKKKSDKKKKLKDKAKRARKKEKQKAEKLKLKKEKKRKQREKERKAEKEILKKLKKEIELNLEEVEREERSNRKKKELEENMQKAVSVKIEKDDHHEKDRPPEDLRNFLDKKVGKVKDLREKVEKKKLNRNKDTDGSKNYFRKEEKLDKEDIEVGKVESKEIKIEAFLENDNYIEGFHKPAIPIVDISKLGVEEYLSAEKKPNDNLSDDFGLVEKLSSADIKKFVDDEVKLKTKSESAEVVGVFTPDTDEYHSNWESDDGISPVAKVRTTRHKREWESDEEIFDRLISNKKIVSGSPDLEVPLQIKKFPRRDFDRRESSHTRSRPRSPEYFDVDNEIKLLEAERISLSKERMRLEVERIRIHELERKKSMEEMEYICEGTIPKNWESTNFQHKEDRRRSRWDLREDCVDSSTSKICTDESDEKLSIAKGDVQLTADSADIKVTIQPDISINISSSPEITSTKSPTPTVLENAYQEFMRAVSVGDDSKDFLVISSTESEIPESASDRPTISDTRGQKQNRLSRSKRNKKHLEITESRDSNKDFKVIGTTDPKILQEILLPGEIPIADIPMPMPVPSPQLEVLQNLPVFNVVPLIAQDPIPEPNPVQQFDSVTEAMQEESPATKPFSFSTLVLPSKKSVILEKSNWNLEDSDDDLPNTNEKVVNSNVEHETPRLETMKVIEQNPVITHETVKKSGQNTTETMPNEKKVASDRQTYREWDTKERERKKEERRKDERLFKRRHSRSRSPPEHPKDKRRKEEESKRREDDNRRRDPETRRKEEEMRRREDDSRRKDRLKRGSSPPRYREQSPRRRRPLSPSPRRHPIRLSPRRQDNRRTEKGDRRSPLRSSPIRRRRSLSPPKPLNRRRSSSPKNKSPLHFNFSRSSKSPGHSPMDGLKTSVADSTISDDLLLQPFTRESSNSPVNTNLNSTSTSRKSRITISPKRPSLDERISQVLGIEVDRQPQWKPEENQGYTQRQNIIYPNYHQNQMFGLKDPPVSSPVPITSKVVQVGNILQVVPTEDICLPPPPVVQPVSVQKILQVGNMIQIVPTEMDVILPPLPPPLPPEEIKEPKEPPIVVPVVEKPSAEALLTAKNAERLAERTKKRLEKQERKNEKERKKKERDKNKNTQLKISTEEMIKRALEMDGFIGGENDEVNLLVPEIISDTPGLDPSKSILSTVVKSRLMDHCIRPEKRKSVQFADGVRPGEGTSPSGGEELSSPPPQTEILPKAKKYRKIDSIKKKKRKIKVKVIKKRQTAHDTDEEYENLPPPPPPPGSPPPHIFPPRIKLHTVNNIPPHYLPAYGITTAPQTTLMNQRQQSVAYRIPPPTAIYRTLPPPLPTNPMVQHYPRSSVNVHMPPPPMPTSTQIPHRARQPYCSF